jgi:nicotinamidase/pyrazinamidase
MSARGASVTGGRATVTDRTPPSDAGRAPSTDRRAPSADRRPPTADPDFVDSWPAHCRIGSDGALFHPAAEPALEHVQAIFRKGHHSAAYSGFEGFTVEADRKVALADWLRDRAIEQVDVVGIATDHCVRATALDSADEGFETTVLLDLTAGVAPETTAAALAELAAAGVVTTGAPA